MWGHRKVDKSKKKKEVMKKKITVKKIDRSKNLKTAKQKSVPRWTRTHDPMIRSRAPYRLGQRQC